MVWGGLYACVVFMDRLVGAFAQAVFTCMLIKVKTLESS